MEALKGMIRDRLHTSPLVAKALEERPDLKDDPTNLLQFLEERGLIEDIFTSLETELQQKQAPSHQPQYTHKPVVPVRPTESVSPSWGVGESSLGSQQLRVTLTCGMAFLDFLEEPEAGGRELCWYVTFGKQRHTSHGVPAVVDPRFDEVIYLQLPANTSRASLLHYAVPIHLALISRTAPRLTEDPLDYGQPILLCSHFLEWRRCLAAPGGIKLTEELKGAGRRHQLSVGVLHGEIELMPSASTQEALLDVAVGAHLRAEEQSRAEVMRRVFEGLDRWWAEYHQLYASRNIRLFAQTENRLFLPVTSFVTPLEAGRSLDTPLHAFRWVSLMGLDREAAPENSEPCWHTVFALWAKGRGSVEEKAVLLCSLLLGFSLDAWCCLGSDARGQPHAWVIVRDKGDHSVPQDVVCWDVQEVARINANDPRYLASYSSIDLVFNHQRLLVCHVDVLARVSFNFSDPRCWLTVPLDDEALTELRLYPVKHSPPFTDLRPRLWNLPVEIELLEESIENRLIESATTHRKAAGRPITIDAHLSQLLQVALADLELQRLSGHSRTVTFDIAQLVKRVVPAHQEMRAVPVQFNHLRVSHFWPALINRQSVRELLACHSSSSFAVRVRILRYPEHAVVAWVMLAVYGP